jgi:hypothetical protein
MRNAKCFSGFQFPAPLPEAGLGPASTNLSHMRFRRIVAAALFLALVFPQTALAREPGATWESETQGAPVSTMQGRWTESDDAREAELTFVGGHLIQAGTTFTATWLSPFTTAEEKPRYEQSYEFENYNEFGKTIEMVESFRFRFKGERWWPWLKHRQKLKPGMTSGGSGSLFMGGPNRPVQFEWRLTGTIQAPTYLRGSATFSIN